MFRVNEVLGGKWSIIGSTIDRQRDGRQQVMIVSSNYQILNRKRVKTVLHWDKGDQVR